MIIPLSYRTQSLIGQLEYAVIYILAVFLADVSALVHFASLLIVSFKLEAVHRAFIRDVLQANREYHIHYLHLEYQFPIPLLKPAVLLLGLISLLDIGLTLKTARDFLAAAANVVDSLSLFALYLSCLDLLNSPLAAVYQSLPSAQHIQNSYNLPLVVRVLFEFPVYNNQTVLEVHFQTQHKVVRSLLQKHNDLHYRLLLKANFLQLLHHILVNLHTIVNELKAALAFVLRLQLVLAHVLSILLLAPLKHLPLNTVRLFTRFHEFAIDIFLLIRFFLGPNLLGAVIVYNLQLIVILLDTRILTLLLLSNFILLLLIGIRHYLLENWDAWQIVWTLAARARVKRGSID